MNAINHLFKMKAGLLGGSATGAQITNFHFVRAWQVRALGLSALTNTLLLTPEQTIRA